LDEYRHVAEKLQKAENIIEKYKKKLEETADLKRQVKVNIYLKMCFKRT
jgi:protein HOOK3